MILNPFSTNHSNDVYSPVTAIEWGTPPDHVGCDQLCHYNLEACFPWRMVPAAKMQAITVWSLLDLHGCFFRHLDSRRCTCKDW
jgi:hypothetical protein